MEVGKIHTRGGIKYMKYPILRAKNWDPLHRLRVSHLCALLRSSLILCSSYNLRQVGKFQVPLSPPLHEELDYLLMECYEGQMN